MGSSTALRFRKNATKLLGSRTLAKVRNSGTLRISAAIGRNFTSNLLRVIETAGETSGLPDAVAVG